MITTKHHELLCQNLPYNLYRAHIQLKIFQPVMDGKWQRIILHQIHAPGRLSNTKESAITDLQIINNLWSME